MGGGNSSGAVSLFLLIILVGMNLLYRSTGGSIGPVVLGTSRPRSPGPAPGAMILDSELPLAIKPSARAVLFVVQSERELAS